MISYKDKNKKKTFKKNDEEQENSVYTPKTTISKENMSTKPVAVKKEQQGPLTELQQVQQVAQKNKNNKYTDFINAQKELQTVKNTALNNSGFALADVSNKTMLERGNNIGKELSYDNRQLGADLEQNRQETVRKMQEVISKDKNVQQKQKNADEALNDYIYADYLNNLMQEEGKKYNLWDKTGGRAISAVPDLFSGLGLGTKYRGENGREYLLPSKYEIRDQNIENQSNGLMGFAGDVMHEGAKQLLVKGINRVTGGFGGSALYFTDIFGDTLKQNVNEGYDAKTSLANATLKTGQNYIKQKLMGGLNGQLTGGQTSELQDILTSKWSKLITNPKIANILGSGSAEFVDEFTDTYIENIIDTATKDNAGLDIGKYLDNMFSPETFKEAFYSGAVGGATGALGGYEPNPQIRNFDRNNVSNKKTISQNNIDNTKQLDYNNVINERESGLNGREITGANQTGINQEINREQSTNDSRTSGEGDGGVRVLNETKDYKQVKDNIDNLKATHKRGAFFDSYTEDEFKTFKTYQTPDGKSSISVKPDGDITALVSEGKKGMATGLLMKARENGGTKMDCYGKFLKELYEQHGFKAVARVHYGRGYNEQMDNYIDNAIKEGKAKDDSDFDIYFMMKNNDDIDTVRNNIGKYETTNIDDLPYMDYDEAYNFRDSQLEQQGNESGGVAEKEKSKPTQSLKEIRQEVEEKTGKTMSKYIETSSKATGTVGDIPNMNYEDIVYTKKTHNASEEQALRELAGKDIDTNVSDVHAKFRGTERLTNVDSAKITELIKQTDSLAKEAIKNGNDYEYNKRMEQLRILKGDYAVAASEAGQFTEYAKVIKELDPDTQIDVLNRFLEREKRRGNKKYEDVTLSKELVEEYKKAKTDEERDVIIEKIKDDASRKIKITFADKANEFRFLSMLGNLKTHGRNIIGNVGMYSLQSFKDGVAAIGEDIYAKTSKKGLETRTKTLKPATKEVKKYVNDTVDSFMKDETNKFNENKGLKGDLEGRKQKFSDKNIIGKTLNKFSYLNKKVLDWEDKYFSSKMTKQAMKGFLTANGIETNADIEAHPELIAQALDYAIFKGKEATFHQDSTTATAIRNFRDKLYTGSGFSKVGGLAIDTTLPFVSTPANIAKTALEYTPVIGFGDINKQFQNAPDNMKANVIIDSLSKQFSGAALMAVGAFLASKGLIKGAGEGDKEDKTEASLGNASYSIKIGNSTYDLSWLSPTAIPFFEGVEIFNAFKKANSKGGIKATDTMDLIDTMFGTLNPMTDMSVLQSVERIMTSIAYGGNAVKSATSTTFSSYLQQYIPTLLSQIAQVGDTKQRNTNTGGNVLEKTWDQIKYKIPGARNTLPEKVDVWGDTNKTASNVAQRGFEAFISPANRKDYKVDKTTKELERLARETDDTSMLPTVKNKSLTINKKEYDLKGKDYVNLQKTYGKTAKEKLDKLTESETYKNADDIEKQSMVKKLYDYASYKAKENYAKEKGINFDSGKKTSYAMIDALNIPYEKYVEYKVSGNESASDMIDKLNKAGFSEAQKGAVMNYFDRAYYVNEDKLYDTLENSDLSDKQKELVMKKYRDNITDKERERYRRANDIGIGYDLYTNFRSFVSNVKDDSRSGGLSKKQKVINWIQEQKLTAKQKYDLYNDYVNNQGIISYYD